MITIHHLANSRSQRVLWLLEELGLAYEVVRHEREPKTLLAPRGMRAIHPLGKSPILVEDGRVMAETGAIVEYLLARHGGGRLRPPIDTEAGLRATYWLHYAEGSAMPPLVMKLVFSRMPLGAGALLRPLVRKVAERAQSGYVDPQLKLHADYWEAELGKAQWFAGDEFSIADIMMSFPVEAGAKRIGYDERPRLQAFLEAIHARPAYLKALERGGAYVYAG